MPAAYFSSAKIRARNFPKNDRFGKRDLPIRKWSRGQASIFPRARTPHISWERASAGRYTVASISLEQRHDVSETSEVTVSEYELAHERSSLSGAAEVVGVAKGHPAPVDTSLAGSLAPGKSVGVARTDNDHRVATAAAAAAVTFAFASFLRIG